LRREIKFASLYNDEARHGTHPLRAMKFKIYAPLPQDKIFATI